MKIVIDARESGTSSGRYVDKLVEYLHKLGPKQGMVILTKSPRIDFIKSIAPNFKVVKSDFKEFTFAEQLGFLKQINSLKADLVHFSMPQQPVFYQGRVVTTFHDLTTARFKNPTKNAVIFWLKQQVYKWLVKRVAKKSVKLIAVTKFVKEDVAQYTNTPKSKIAVTYEAADKIAEAAEAIESLVGKKFIMYVGRATPHKNLERLAEAFAQLKPDHPELLLVLAGKKDANYQKLQQKFERQGLKDIIFTDFVGEAQLKWLYQNTAAYVFASLSEGFGLPGLEAMAHGAPVVSSNATCLPELYGSAAKYFDPLDVSDMAGKIGEVLDDKKLALGLSEKGKVQAAKYSWQRMAEQTLEVYNQILG